MGDATINLDIAGRIRLLESDHLGACKEERSYACTEAYAPRLLSNPEQHLARFQLQEDLR